MPPPLDPVRLLRHRARRAHLDHGAADAVHATRAVVALHGSDPATVHLSLWARMPPASLAHVASALRTAAEQDRAIVRAMAMRRTVHLVDRADAGAVLGLAAARIAPNLRKQAESLLVAAGLATEANRADAFDRVAAEILDALDGGDLATDALGDRVPALGAKVVVAPDKPYGGPMTIGRVVLDALGTDGRVLRARATGGWRVQRCTWARRDRWLPDVDLVPAPDAYAPIVRGWLRAFGPAPLSDVAWWTGLPKRDVSQALARLGAQVVQVDVAGGPTGQWALADDVEAWRSPADPVGAALLPALDPAVMARSDRSPFLSGGWTGAMFDRSGNAGPSVWWDGRIVGGWACRRDGEVVVKILDADLPVDHAAIDAEARRLTEALAGEVVQPRFPTALSKEMASG